ncbi:NEAT domain-containing protein [Intestinibacter sp.]
MKFLKHLFTICLTILCLTNVAYAAGSKHIEPGLYNVKNDVYHEQEIGMSMARTYLDETMQVEVVGDGTYNYIVGFSGTEYMNNHRITVDKKSVDIEVVEEENSNIKIKFRVLSLDSKVQTQIYVDAMERDVEFDIIPNFDTLELVEKYEVEEDDVEAISSENAESADNTQNEKANSKSSTPVIITGVAATVVVVAGIVVFIKKKK